MSQVYTNNPNTLNTTGNTLNNGTVINTMYRDSTYHPQPQTSISFNNSTTPAVPLGGTQLSGSQLKGSNVRMSRIKEGTHYQNTNNLYRPLKETFEHPEILRQHEGLTPVVAQSSYVSKEYRKLNTLELRNMEDNTFIPDAELVPTNNLEKVRGEKFVAVDACQKIAGPAISQEEMEKIRRQGMKKSEVLYEPRQPPVVHVPVPKQPKYTGANFDNYDTKPYKYNLFSSIDQPVNECRLFGCGKCTGCPSNEVIARENFPPSVIKPEAQIRN